MINEVEGEPDPATVPPREVQEIEPPDWHRRDAAGNYGEAIAAIRARLVASGKARL